jgi:hypothetical protein
LIKQNYVIHKIIDTCISGYCPQCVSNSRWNSGSFSWYCFMNCLGQIPREENLEDNLDLVSKYSYQSWDCSYHYCWCHSFFVILARPVFVPIALGNGSYKKVCGFCTIYAWLFSCHVIQARVLFSFKLTAIILSLSLTP